MKTATKAVEDEIEVSRRVLADLFGSAEKRDFAVEFWDGIRDEPGHPPAQFELVLRHPGALRAAFLPPTEASMGAAYVAGLLDLRGDAEAAVRLADEVVDGLARPGLAFRTLTRLLRLPAVRSPGTRDAGHRRSRLSAARHSRESDAAAVRSHYDVGNDFYRLFLDSRMVYSCGYFADGVDDLDGAQEAKLDYICRKLQLRVGDRFLDIGCGWGALVIHAAERYGVDAVGVTLSAPQAAFAAERVAAAGISSRCRVEVRDYRDLSALGTFDKVASVGMVEHVGTRRLGTYFGAIGRAMAAGGLFLNHGIVSLRPEPGWASRVARRVGRASFMQRFVFPDSELQTPAEVIGPGERAGLELRDVESLREHYVRTLRHWVARLEGRQEEAVRLVGEETFRVWRLYMAASAAMFRGGRIGVVQALWAKLRPDGSASLPPTRSGLYRLAREEGYE